MAKKPIVIERPSVQEILSQLTPFVFDDQLEARFGELLARRKETISRIQRLVEEGRLSVDTVASVIKEDPEEGLGAVISIMGLSQEEFLRHITLLRVDKANELEEATDAFTSEWKMKKISKELASDDQFAKDAIGLLFGRDNKRIEARVPLFLISKLDEKKIGLDKESLIDSLIRTGLKGRYDAMKGQPIVETAKAILRSLKVESLVGEISVTNVSRKMDIVVPNLDNPLVFVESGIFSTTARELSEKSLVERQVRQDIQRYYPDAVIVRILDGIGWLARGGNALKDVIETADYVLTGRSIALFEQIIRQHVPEEYFSKD